MRQEEYIAEGKSNILYNYLVFFPDKYKESNKEKWPLIVFLHGAFERGNCLQDVKRNALPKIAEIEEFPFIIIAPQCPENSFWKAEQIIEITDKSLSEFNIDSTKIYLTGLSMGGFATWQIASRYPSKYAAIIPICGGGNTLMATKLTNLPIWAFHGEKDRVIPVQQTIDMVEGVNVAGGNAKLTIYPYAFHDSWTETYENNEIYDWLLSHKIEI
jgi:predicted peptidase